MGNLPYNSGIIYYGLFIEKAPTAINNMLDVFTEPFLVCILQSSTKVNRYIYTPYVETLCYIFYYLFSIILSNSSINTIPFSSIYFIVIVSMHILFFIYIYISYFSKCFKFFTVILFIVIDSYLFNFLFISFNSSTNSSID